MSTVNIVPIDVIDSLSFGITQFFERWISTVRGKNIIVLPPQNVHPGDVELYKYSLALAVTDLKVISLQYGKRITFPKKLHGETIGRHLSRVNY